MSIAKHAKLFINEELNQRVIGELIEWTLTNKGIKSNFCFNKEIIGKAISNRKLLTLNHHDEILAFMIWREGVIDIEIDYFIVNPKFQGKGIGRHFICSLFNHFHERGFIALQLYCSPKESQGFWQKIGFIKFPDRGFSQSDLTYYKPLIEVEKLSDNPEESSKLELWDINAGEIENQKPRWSWSIQAGLNSIAKPIIQPINPEWNLRLTIGGNIFKEGKAKHFLQNSASVFHEPFLYIQQGVIDTKFYRI